MTKCLWRDPFYDNLDEISKIMMPFFSKKDEAYPIVRDVKIELSDIVSSLAYCNEIDVTKKIIFKCINEEYPDYSAYCLSSTKNGINVEVDMQNIPKEIELNHLKPPPDITIKASVTIKHNAVFDSIVYGFLFRHAIFNIYERRFGSTKESLFKLKDLKYKIEAKDIKKISKIFSSDRREYSSRSIKNCFSDMVNICKDWLRQANIRHEGFVPVFEDKVIQAIIGDREALTWLKVLKSRSHDGMPIYSMELNK